MDPVGLGALLACLPQADDPNLLVGYKTNDDAGIYRLTDDLAIVVTADFITPPVNDPDLFGQIAAANALSDVYAMGGDPKVCLNLVCFPSGKLPPEQLNGIVTGALTKITEAGAVLAGGHSVQDSEPKFGLSVVGLVHPRKYWSNSGAQSGDGLVLTKPIGSGVLLNANIKGWVSPAAMDACIRTLSQLNKDAAAVMRDFDIHAVTDISGFGLAGHALEMAKGSEAGLYIHFDALPIMDEALTMYRKGVTTGVNGFNHQLTAAHTRLCRCFADRQEQILYDPQTSGGLLAALPMEQTGALLTALRQKQVSSAALIGHVQPYDAKAHLYFV